MQRLRNVFHSIGCLAVFAVAHADAASAQTLPPQYDVPEVRAAISSCTADATKLCAGVVPGNGRIIRCLIAQPDALSPACRESILKAKTALGR